MKEEAAKQRVLAETTMTAGFQGLEEDMNEHYKEQTKFLVDPDAKRCKFEEETMESYSYARRRRFEENTEKSLEKILNHLGIEIEVEDKKPFVFCDDDSMTKSTATMSTSSSSEQVIAELEAKLAASQNEVENLKMLYAPQFPPYDSSKVSVKPVKRNIAKVQSDIASHAKTQADARRKQRRREAMALFK